MEGYLECLMHRLVHICCLREGAEKSNHLSTSMEVQSALMSSTSPDVHTLLFSAARLSAPSENGCATEVALATGETLGEVDT